MYIIYHYSNESKEVLGYVECEAHAEQIRRSNPYELGWEQIDLLELAEFDPQEEMSDDFTA